MFGLKFDITNKGNGNYNITVVDKVRGQEIKKEAVGQTPHEVTHLKPCTEYEHKVVFIDSHGTETPCSIPENKATTTEMSFRLNVKNTTDSTSINLSWTTETKNCRNISNNLSYSCKCNSRERPGQTKHHKNTPVAGTFTAQPDGGSCRIDGLKPYTDYKCQVQTKYKGRFPHDGRYEGTLKTEPGVPADIENLEATPQEHNVIKVTCKNTDFNGPDRRYRARLDPPDGSKEITNTKKCEFEFKDLSYLTTYSVEIMIKRSLGFWSSSSSLLWLCFFLSTKRFAF
ncbi:uncharacterized protein KZ484_005992 isoform 1-T1 [Pholidichthys leucotaenia]